MKPDYVKEINESYFKCSCGSELLQITEEVEFFPQFIKPTNYSREFSFAIFRDYQEPYTLKRRLKYIWKILTTGKPHLDQIILNEEQVQRMIQWFKDREGYFQEMLLERKDDLESTKSIK